MNRILYFHAFVAPPTGAGGLITNCERWTYRGGIYELYFHNDIDKKENVINRQEGFESMMSYALPES